MCQFMTHMASYFLSFGSMILYIFLLCPSKLFPVIIVYYYVSMIILRQKKFEMRVLNKKKVCNANDIT